jgi:hypothetical protein
MAFQYVPQLKFGKACGNTFSGTSTKFDSVQSLIAERPSVKVLPHCLGGSHYFVAICVPWASGSPRFFPALLKGWHGNRRLISHDLALLLSGPL